jgi:hypothetical protein
LIRSLANHKKLMNTIFFCKDKEIVDYMQSTNQDSLVGKATNRTRLGYTGWVTGKQPLESWGERQAGICGR